MRALTIKDAARVTRLSEKALRRRIERGQLPAVMGHDGRKRVPVGSLREHGLLADGSPDGTPVGTLPPRDPENGAAPVADLLERLERLAAENARLRMISERAESLEAQAQEERLRLEAELKAAKERLEAVAQAPWWKRGRLLRELAAG